MTQAIGLIEQAAVDAGLISAAVFGVIVAIKVFKWAIRAL